MAKVIFLHLSVIHSVHRGGICLSACWDTTPPRSRHPPGADTPQTRCRVIVPYLLLPPRRILGSRSLLVVCFFTPTESPRGPPWNEGHRPKVRHETSVFEVPAQEQRTQFCSSSTNTFITCSLYTIRGCCTSPGAPGLWARLG